MKRLTEVEPQTTVVVRKIEGNLEIIRYLSDLGITEGVELTLVATEPIYAHVVPISLKIADGEVIGGDRHRQDVDEKQWAKYVEIARKFENKARKEDREDLTQDIIVRLAEVERSNGHEPFTVWTMLRIAINVVKEYWHKLKRQPTFISLNQKVENDEGDSIELWETMPDDEAIDLQAWVEDKDRLERLPRRLVEIASKKVNGEPLPKLENRNLEYHRGKEREKAKKPP